MKCLNVAKLHAYNYDDTDGESQQVFIDIHETPDTPGIYHVVSVGYNSVTGNHVRGYYSEFVDGNEFSDYSELVEELSEHVTVALYDTVRRFDIVDSITGSGFSWYLTKDVGRDMLISALFSRAIQK